jgi:hypothetical protein
VGFPLQVESLEDGVDDSVYAFYIHKAHLTSRRHYGDGTGYVTSFRGGTF